MTVKPKLSKSCKDLTLATYMRMLMEAFTASIRWLNLLREEFKDDDDNDDYDDDDDCFRLSKHF